MKDGRSDERYPRVGQESFLLEAVERRDDKRFIVLCFSMFLCAAAIAHRLNCISVFVAAAKHISLVRAHRSRRENG
jgi:hypothetical protein